MAKKIWFIIYPFQVTLKCSVPYYTSPRQASAQCCFSTHPISFPQQALFDFYLSLTALSFALSTQGMRGSYTQKMWLGTMCSKLMVFETSLTCFRLKVVIFLIQFRPQLAKARMLKSFFFLSRLQMNNVDGLNYNFISSMPTLTDYPGVSRIQTKSPILPYESPNLLWAKQIKAHKKTFISYILAGFFVFW